MGRRSVRRVPRRVAGRTPHDHLHTRRVAGRQVAGDDGTGRPPSREPAGEQRRRGAPHQLLRGRLLHAPTCRVRPGRHLARGRGAPSRHDPCADVRVHRPGYRARRERGRSGDLGPEPARGRPDPLGRRLPGRRRSLRGGVDGIPGAGRQRFGAPRRRRRHRRARRPRPAAQHGVPVLESGRGAVRCPGRRVQRLGSRCGSGRRRGSGV